MPTEENPDRNNQNIQQRAIKIQGQIDCIEIQ